jgi:hypothetical protein
MSKTKRWLPIVEKFDYPFNEMIMWVETWEAWEKTTICLVTLDNWYEVVGYSHCLNADDYDFEIGKEEAYKNACDKIWDVYAFLCAEAWLSDIEDEDDEDEEFICDDCKARRSHK